MRNDEHYMKKEATEIPSHVNPSGKLDEAVKSVYKKYGTDLSAFFQDAYKASARERKQKPGNDELEACA